MATNCLRSLLFIVLIFFSLNSNAQQYETREITDASARESNGLSSDQIVIINACYSDIRIQCSLDQNNWSKKLISNSSGMEVDMTSDVSFFFVKLCGTDSNNTTECVIYKLRPGSKYILKKNDDDGSVVLKKNTQ